MEPPRLVCYGNFTIDDLVLPDGCEHPGLIGGDALYGGLGARLFEMRTEIVAPVGFDLSARVREQIAAAGFAADGFAPRALPTLRNRVCYDAAGGRDWTLYASEADFDRLSPAPEDIPAAYHGAAAHLILAMTLNAQERLVAWLGAHARGLIALDPQEDYIAGSETRLRALIGKVDIFLPSAEEVRRLAGHADWERAAREFSALGPRLVVVKLGAEGCLVYDKERDEILRIGAVRVPAVDTTGAGDAFCGGFMAALVNAPEDVAAAARAGAVAASFAISDYGTAGSFRGQPEAARRRLEDLAAR